MMLALVLKFPSGKYFASPYSRQWKGGLVEWPPSPWRLLRALLSRGFATLGWVTVPEDCRRLFESLGSVLPSYRLPPAELGFNHLTRGDYDFKMSRSECEFLYEAYARVGDGEVRVEWPVKLDRRSMDILKSLVVSLDYLGRTQSWVEISVEEEPIGSEVGSLVFPLAPGEELPCEYELIHLPAPMSPVEFSAWRVREIEACMANLGPQSKNKVPQASFTRSEERILRSFPSDWLASLTQDSGDWQDQGWEEPPGLRLAPYGRPCPRPFENARHSAVARVFDPVTSILLHLGSTSLAANTRLRRGDSLPLGELIHRSLVGLAGQGRPMECPVLTGRDVRGAFLKDHAHAHIFPLDLDGDGTLDHVLIHATMRLDHLTQSAVALLEKIFTGDGIELDVRVIGAGSLDEIGTRLDGRHRDNWTRIVGPSVIWRNCRPLVLPRYRKARGTNSLEGQIQAELSSRSLPTPVRVTPIELSADSAWMKLARRRRRFPAKPPPVEAFFEIELEFPQPLRGPLSLGYAAHFGLGLFAAASETSRCV